MVWFLYNRDLCHEKVNGVVFVKWVIIVDVFSINHLVPGVH